MLIALLMQELTDGPFRNYLFRLEFDTLEEVIRVAEQEDFGVKRAHVSSSLYRNPRGQENEGPEPMELVYESEICRVTNYKKLQRCNRCQKTGQYA